MTSEQVKPSGRSAVMDAIVDAAVELYAGRNPDEVTVRDIAEKAGVSHALVHHYFGTKREVLAAVLDRNAQSFVEEVDWEQPAEDVTVHVFESALQHPDYGRAILRDSLDGVHLDMLRQGYPAIDRMIRLIEASKGQTKEVPPRCDPRVAAAVVVAFNFGWIATEGWLLDAAGLRDRTPAEIREEVECVLRSIVRMAGDE